MIISMLAGIIKLPVFIILFLLFCMTGFAGKMILKNHRKKHPFLALNTHIWTTLILKFLFIKVVPHKAPQSLRKNHYFILSNHLSYLDIVILSSIVPTLFITSSEIKNTFFLGFISEMGGSFFVERRNPYRLKQEIEEIKKVIQSGISVVLFPEGTTSNGEKILPFKKSLIACAVESKTPILPVFINYRSIQSKTIDVNNRDFIYWYGNMKFFNHFIKLIFLVLYLKVEIHFMPQILPDETQNKSQARKLISDLVFSSMEKVFIQKT